MITRITGILNRVLDEELRLQVGPIEYCILIPESVRRQIQTRVGTEQSLYTIHYLEGGQNSNRFIPRLVGFLTEMELEFFELFCTVDKIGIKKALRAMGPPIKDIAAAIARLDVKWMSTLSGIGKASAEQIITTLKTKVTKFTFMTEGSSTPTTSTGVSVNAQVIEDAYQALMVMGLSPTDARSKLDGILLSGTNVDTVESIIAAIFKRAE
jgi:holliday junction DNA helicase RuvA